MRYRGLLGAIAAVAVVNVIIALGVWWAVGLPTAPTAEPEAAPAPAAAEAPPETAPSLAVQRLAELVSGAAFRAVITLDYAGLNELVKRAAAWPEVQYLSVEDTQGRVIAHTDPARVGRSGGAAAGRDKAAASQAGVQEVTVSMAGPEGSGKPGAQLGQVRLGYLADESRRAAVPVVAPPPTLVPIRPDARFPLPLILAAAALAAIPVGLGLAWLTRSAPAAGEPPAADLRKISNVRQARITVAHWMKEADAARAQLIAQRGEAQRLARELGERTSELHRAETRRGELDREAAAWASEREQLHGELGERVRALEDTRAMLLARTAEGETAARRLALFESEMADLQDEVREARGALAGHPMACRELLDQELRQHQHRVIAYISRSIRSSLTSVLGFSKLLLRAGDGPLTEAQRTSAANIHDAGNRLLRVVNDLSDLTQVQAGTMELRDEIVDVAAVVREVAAAATSALGREPEAITVECPTALPAVRGNKRRLTQLLLGLMDAPTPGEGGSTALGARVGEETLDLIVTHRGAAIPGEELATLFDPFSPVDATGMLQDDGRRLRLGLARALAVTIGGQLTVESQEAGDTVFTVTMPVVADVPAVA